MVHVWGDIMDMLYSHLEPQEWRWGVSLKMLLGTAELLTKIINFTAPTPPPPTHLSCSYSLTVWRLGILFLTCDVLIKATKIMGLNIGVI